MILKGRCVPNRTSTTPRDSLIDDFYIKISRVEAFRILHEFDTAGGDDRGSKWAPRNADSTPIARHVSWVC